MSTKSLGAILDSGAPATLALSAKREVASPRDGASKKKEAAVHGRLRYFH
jgi:hypothetical protein